MEITMNISEDEAEVLTILANENGLTASQYATNILSGWLQNRIRNTYVWYAQNERLEMLKEKLGKKPDITKGVK